MMWRFFGGSLALGLHIHVEGHRLELFIRPPTLSLLHFAEPSIIALSYFVILSLLRLQRSFKKNGLVLG